MTDHTASPAGETGCDVCATGTWGSGEGGHAGGWREAMRFAHHAHAEHTYRGHMSANGVLGAGPDSVIVDGDWLANLIEQCDELTASPADADTADLDSAVGIIEGVQHALALTKGARATAEERVYTTEANRLIHEKRERMLQARLTDGTTAGRTYARTGGNEHATTPPVAAAVKRPLIAVPVCGHPGCEFMVRQFEHSTTWNHLDTHGVPVDHEATPPVAATSEEADRG